MASLQIRDMPEDLYESLKLSAEKDHRSLAQQALMLLTSVLKKQSGGKSRRIEILESIRSHKVRSKSKKLDIAELVREDREER